MRVSPLVIGVVASALLAAAAAAQSPPRPRLVAGGQIALSFSSEHVELGSQSGVEVRLALPADADLIRLSTNVGRVEAPRAIAPGRYAAAFTPPEQFFPQLAIVVASARHRGREIAGWAVLPLWGKGDAVVKARPGAEVTVRIGERAFGPVAADAGGVALVPVVVPPGIDHGWSAGRRVDLRLPPARRLHLVAAPLRFSGVTPRRVSVWVVAVDAAGGAGPRPRLTAFGTEPPLRALGPGAWAAPVVVPAGLPARLELSASLPGDALSSRSLALERTSGPPSRIGVTLGARGPRDPVPLQVSLRDALGSLVDGRLVASCSVGVVEGFVRRDTGRYDALWRPPSGPLPASARIRISVSGGSSRDVDLPLAGPSRRLRPHWFWTGVAVSSALLVTGLATRVVALRQSDEYKDPGTSIERRRELKDSGETLTTASSVTLGLGAAAAVAAAVVGYLTFARPRRERSTSSALLPLVGPHVAGFGGRF